MGAREVSVAAGTPITRHPYCDPDTTVFEKIPPLPKGLTPGTKMDLH
jgi:hypothetical protein